MKAFSRRGACPALSAPMQTGDGLLVRLNSVASGLSAKHLIGLCESASRHGNGIVEITARGSFQIRGLTTASAAKLAVEIDALGIEVRSGVPIDVSPLAGLDPAEIADPRSLAEAIRTAIDQQGLASRLGPKVSVVVDGGNSWLDEVTADVRLTAIRSDGEIVWRLAVAGDAASARHLKDLPEGSEAAAVVSFLQQIAVLGLEGRARYVSIADVECFRSTLPPSVLPDISPTWGEIGGSSVGASLTALEIGEAVGEAAISPHVGEMSGRTEGGNVERRLIRTSKLKDSRHVLPLALPFGSIEATSLAAFVSRAETLGASEFRLAPRRTLLVMTAGAEQADAIRVAAEGHGLIANTIDPRLHIAACPGMPACHAGTLATRAIASTVATTAPDLFDGSLALHVSGCAKGCARPTASALTIVGGENEAGLVVGGTAGHRPVAYMRDAASALARIAALVRAGRRDGETAADCLQRLGDKQLAAAATE